jgi:hypothetical protein
MSMGKSIRAAQPSLDHIAVLASTIYGICLMAASASDSVLSAHHDATATAVL